MTSLYCWLGRVGTGMVLISWLPRRCIRAVYVSLMPFAIRVKKLPLRRPLSTLGPRRPLHQQGGQGGYFLHNVSSVLLTLERGYRLCPKRVCIAQTDAMKCRGWGKRLCIEMPFLYPMYVDKEVRLPLFGEIITFVTYNFKV